ncbi:MAG TPA: hypothetical protein VGH42_12100, partial [Verrucomicrobiae bacterium]
ALELKSNDFNYIVTIPDTWTVTFQNQAGFLIASPDGKKTMTLLIGNAKSAKLDPSSIAQYEQVMIQAGAQKVSSKMFTVDGVPAYEFIQRVGKAPYATVTVFHEIVANNKLYNLQSAIMGGDASQDSEMQEGLASFHFLQQPKPSMVGSLGVKLTVVGIIMAGIVFWVIRSRKTEI